jgi:ABC-type dipeptide transport system, periplasmic component
MPAAAPIPPLPGDPKARLGIATGHDDNFGRFIVGTAPYMFEGTDLLDFSLPPDDQEPVAGYDVGRSIVLVRNPSTTRPRTTCARATSTASRSRSAGTRTILALKVDAGELDMVYDGVPPAAQIRQYASNPDLQDQIHSDPSDAVRYIEMNLATPPFDDQNVRIALNYALDKEGFRQLRGGPLFGELAGHIMVNSLQGDQLKDYDPYPSPNGQGDLTAAKAAMAASKYDSDG